MTKKKMAADLARSVVELELYADVFIVPCMCENVGSVIMCYLDMARGGILPVGCYFRLA